MKTKVKIAKRLLSILLVFLFSINSFAAVSDNDGSAFITKAEFDALKSSFQSQIDNYNRGIDSKIDNAIASYLAGINISVQLNLELDANCSYKFPLKYDTASNWNNPDCVWYDVSSPQLTEKQYQQRFFLGGPYDNGSASTKQPWVTVQQTDSNGFIKISTPSDAVPDKYKWYFTMAQGFDYTVAKRNGQLFLVNKTTGYRSINLGTGFENFKIYQLQKKGLGAQIIAYDSMFNFSNPSWGPGVVKFNTGAKSPFLYEMFMLANVNVRNQTQASNGDLWTPYSLKGKQGGTTSSFAHFAQGEKLTLAQIKARKSVASPWDQSIILADETSNISSIASDFDNSDMQSIYGRGSDMPAQLAGHWKFKSHVWSSTSKTQWACTNDNLNDSGTLAMWGVKFTDASSWQCSPNYYCYAVFMPYVKAADNTAYDSSDDDDFSKLPSPLVTYTDSKGKLHYFDEGMFLGNIKAKGDVNFTVNFQRNSGSGTKVKLHISKKPFSYDFNNADLLEYKISNVSGKEQELVYGTSYNVTVPSIEKDDQLYMEWVPVTSGDLAALTSFTDYAIMCET